MSEKAVASIGAEVVPTEIELPPQIRCLDCGGWPLPRGAIFIPVAHCKDGTRLADLDPKLWHEFQKETRTRPTPVPSVGFICELCFIWRLERRAQIVAATSTPKAYYAFKRAKDVLRDKAQEIQNKPVGKDKRTK